MKMKSHTSLCFGLILSLLSLFSLNVQASPTPETPVWDSWRDTKASANRAFTISWAHTGFIGTAWRVIENSRPIPVNDLTTSGTWDEINWQLPEGAPGRIIGTKGSQSGQYSTTKPTGTYTYIAELCTDNTYQQCSISKPLTITVGEAVPVDPPVGLPGKPQINQFEGAEKGYFLVGSEHPISFVKSWGMSGTQWKLFLNGNQIKTGALPSALPDIPQPANSSFIVPAVQSKLGYEPMAFRVEYCNDKGCTSSDVKSINAAIKDGIPGAGDGTSPNKGRIVPAKNPDFIKKSSAEYLAEENAIINALPNKAVLIRARSSRQIKLDPNRQIQNVNLSDPANWPENVERVARVLTTPSASAQKNYEQLLFPIRNKYSVYGSTYSFQGFMNAVASFPKFCSTEIGPNAQGEDSDALCKRTLATMFAHNNQETGAHEAKETVGVEEWRQGLAYVNEAGCELTGEGCGYDSSCQLDTWTGDIMACPGYGTNNKKKYFGRGAKQLSYNYNYGKFSRVLFGTKKTLLMDPDRVGREGSLALLSAFWFFMEPQPPKPSMYDMIYGFWEPPTDEKEIERTKHERGFGVSTMIINGGVECGGSGEVAQSKNRISYYLSFAEFFGIRSLVEKERLGCAGMLQFDGNGNTNFPLYWEKDWNQAGKCQLVNYEAGPFSAFYPGDYEKCVVYHNDRPTYNSTKGYHPFAPVTADQVVYPEG